MSHVQTGMTTVYREISIEDLRRAEEERRAAELADRMRREEESRQRALAEAKSIASQAHNQLSNMQQQLNKEKNRLPDLVYSFDSLPEMPRSGEVSDWQNHANTVSALVKGWRQELNHAIKVAEEVLNRRIRTQKAWQDNKQLLALHQANAGQLKSLQELVPDVASKINIALSVLSDDSSYENIESFNSDLSTTIEEVRNDIKRLTNIGLNNDRIASQIQKITTPFEMVMGDMQLRAWKEINDTKEHAFFEDELAKRLATANWNETDIPKNLVLDLARLRSGIVKLENTNFFVRLIQAIDKKSWMEKAESMLNSPPSYLPSVLVDEWQFISGELEMVAFGKKALSTTLTRRYSNIHEASKQALTQAYVFEQAKAAIAECGMIIEEDIVDMQFGEGAVTSKTMAFFTIPGFYDRKVVLSIDSDGNTTSLPIRFNDSNSEFEKMRDIEFNHAICDRLGNALSSLASSGIQMDMAQEKTEHPVLLASDLGIELCQCDEPNIARKQSMREV